MIISPSIPSIVLSALASIGHPLKRLELDLEILFIYIIYFKKYEIYSHLGSAQYFHQIAQQLSRLRAWILKSLINNF